MDRRRFLLSGAAAGALAHPAAASVLLKGAGSAGLSAVTLSNSALLDKSATLTKVGALSNVTGTPSLTDTAGGRFLLRQNGATWELCAGLTITDRGVNASHSIQITDGAGPKSFTVTITAITAASLAARGSIQFPRRNGATAGNAIATSAGLYGIFGANVTGGEDGAVAFFFDVRRGSLVALSSDQDINSSPFVMGTASSTSGRGFMARYFPEDSSTASGTAMKGRLGIAGKDHASANQIGQYLLTDADGVPTGAATSGSFLRTAVISDDIPRLVVLRYKASTLTMDIITIRLTDFVVEQGDSKVHATWVGMGTNASRTNYLALGTHNTSASGVAFVGPALLTQNYFPGRLSDLLITGGAGADGTNANWQDIAKGVAPSTTFSGLIRYQWTLQGTGDLTQTAGSQTASSFAVTGTATTGTQMKPTNVAGAGLAPLSKGDGYVFGLQIGGATSRSLVLPVSIIGAATHVEARVSRGTLSGATGDNAIIKDWARCTSSAVTGQQNMTITAIPPGFDFNVEFRREDDTSVIAINRQRIRVGYKFGVLGQSQQDIMMFGSGGPGSGVSLPTTTSVTVVAHRPRMKQSRKVDIGVIDNTTDWANGLLAFSERCGVLAATVPICLVSMSQAGQSLGTFYADQVVYSGTYKAFGDYTTAGVGLVTDVLLSGGKDITGFLHMHGTADSGRNATYGSLLNGLYAGTDDGNLAFTNDPGLGGPSVTTSLVRSFAGASLEYATRVVMVPMQRHAYVTTGAGASQASFDTFRANYQNLRKVQVEWAPSSGVTTTVRGYTLDTMLESSTETGHQIITDVRGNARIALRYAMSILAEIGLSTYDEDFAATSASRSTNVITVGFNRPNAGAIFTPNAGAPTCFEVSEDGGTTWSKAAGSIAFTPAIAANTVTLTRGAGNWAANTRVRASMGGPIEYFTVSQTAPTRTTHYASENTDLDNYLYETRTDASPTSGVGWVQGVPLRGSYADLVAA